METPPHPTSGAETQRYTETVRCHRSGNATETGACKADHVSFLNEGVMVVTPAIGRNGFCLARVGKFVLTGRHGTCYLYVPK